MSSKIVLNDPDLGTIVASLAGTYYMPGPCTNVSRVDETGRLLGGVVFSGYTGESVGMHAASLVTHWVTRDLCWMVFDYAFNQLMVKRVFGQVPEDNWQALRFNRHIGFTEIGRIEGVYPGPVDCIIMRMNREECRFLDWRPRGYRSNVVDVEEDDGR